VERRAEHEGGDRLVREITCETPLDSVAEHANDDASTHSDNAPRVLSASLTPLSGEAGRSLGKMLVVADVTVQRELDTMKSDFVSYVAHELRTPLTTILGYASLLHDDTGDYPVSMRGEMTDSIIRHCRRLNRMISELLDVSRLDAGRVLALRPVTVDLAALCKSVLDGARATISDSQKVELRFEPAQAEISLGGDPDRLEQIVTNLVSNAIKYSPDGGVVTLRLRECGDEVELQVEDTGMGMSPEQQAQLFQKFYRTPDAQASGIKGTGLGLFLVRQLVEAHGGRIEVQSEQGRGTTFTVTLPKTGAPSSVR
jgi:signal transduction histidine kinase